LTGDMTIMSRSRIFLGGRGSGFCAMPNGRFGCSVRRRTCAGQIGALPLVGQATPSEKFIGGSRGASIYAFLPQRGRPEVVASKCSKLKRQTIPPSDKARSCAKVLCKRTGTLENVGLRIGVQRGRIPASGYRPSMAKSNCVATWWRHSTQFAPEAALKCK
jgi:hypothetical protein